MTIPPKGSFRKKLVEPAERRFALRLAVYFRVLPEQWLNHQRNCELLKARAEGFTARIARDVRSLPANA